MALAFDLFSQAPAFLRKSAILCGRVHLWRQPGRPLMRSGCMRVMPPGTFSTGAGRVARKLGMEASVKRQTRRAPWIAALRAAAGQNGAGESGLAVRPQDDLAAVAALGGRGLDGCAGIDADRGRGRDGEAFQLGGLVLTRLISGRPPPQSPPISTLPPPARPEASSPARWRT